MTPKVGDVLFVEGARRARYQVVQVKTETIVVTPLHYPNATSEWYIDELDDPPRVIRELGSGLLQEDGDAEAEGG